MVPDSDQDPTTPENEDGYSCALNVKQAFDFNLGVQAPVGFITSLTLGGTALATGYMIPGALIGTAGTTTALLGQGAAATVTAVAVLESVAWQLGDSDPIEFVARVASPTKAAIMALKYAGTPSVDVIVSWVVYDYDDIDGKYFVAFSNALSASGTGAPARGQIQKNDQQPLRISVGSSHNTDVVQPQNYTLKFSVVPTPLLVQTLYLATQTLRRVNKPWGRSKF